MTKKQAWLTGIAIYGAINLISFVYARKLNRELSRVSVPDLPPLSPAVQRMADYVEKYPKLEDDPKIANAIAVLEEYENPEK